MLKAIGTGILIIISGIFGLSFRATTIPTTSVPMQKVAEPKQIVATSTKTFATTTAQSKTANKPTVAKKIKPVATALATNKKMSAVSATSTPIQTTPQVPFETLNILVRKSLVNILCSTEAGGPLSPISGSGVIISATGVILTNAHIGQFFLLKDFDGQKNSVECAIRTGNPASLAYTAELIYISPTWISENKTILIDPVAKGTGEHDFAFLLITGKIDGTSLPTAQPFLPISLSEGNPINSYALLASYPAGFLGGQSILQNLYQTSAITTVKDVFTFGSTTIDLISVPGTVVSQKGSSGGAVVNGAGQLIGIISTESEANTTGQTDLRAITLAYINRDLKNESGSSLYDILAFPADYATNFNQNIAPKLTEILTNAILKK